MAATDVKPPLAPASLAGGWKYTAGSLTTNCDGKSQTKDATGSSFLLEESPNEVGAFVYRKGGCAVSLSLEGKTLSAPAGTSCAEGSLQVVYQKMSMTGSASAADIQSSGTMTGSFGAKTVSCTFASSGRVARL